MAVPANWDFQTPDWALDTSTYVSAPSSLRCQNISPWWRALAKSANLTNIEQGRLISWLRSAHFSYTQPALFFRHQAPPGGVIPHTHYGLRFFTNIATLARVVDGVDTTVDLFTLGITMSINTWYKYRLSWWNAYNYQNALSTAVRLERWDGSAWVLIGTLYDPYNLGFGSATNRVGVGSNYASAGTRYAHHDDTEIWTPAA